MFAGRPMVALVVMAWMAVPAASAAQDLSADEIIVRSQEAFLAPGTDMRAHVTMTLVNKAGRERVREMTMLRKDLEGGDQKYFIYFHQPGDVRDMTFMVWKYQDRDDDRWLFVPAIQLVRRIAAHDGRSSFVGSDFTYEDVSGRDVGADTHTLVGEETVNGTDAYVIESVPKDANTEYRRKVSWIAKTTFLSLKEEYHDRQDDVVRVYDAEAVAEIDGYPTVTHRTMTDVSKGHRTEVVLDRVEYDLGLDEDVFVERSLRRPPSEWIR